MEDNENIERVNKFGGINDYPNCNLKIYSLWYHMIRRCYDTSRHNEIRCKGYKDCEVSDEWMRLSNFARDIKEFPNYELWLNTRDYCLDKDTLVPGNKIYSKDTCCFITRTENIRDMNRRHPQTEGTRKTQYILTKDGKSIHFNKEKDACEYIGVRQCSVSWAYKHGRKCKGYTITKSSEDGNSYDKK